MPTTPTKFTSRSFEVINNIAQLFVKWTSILISKLFSHPSNFSFFSVARSFHIVNKITATQKGNKFKGCVKNGRESPFFALWKSTMNQRLVIHEAGFFLDKKKYNIDLPYAPSNLYSYLPFCKEFIIFSVFSFDFESFAGNILTKHLSPDFLTKSNFWGGDFFWNLKLPKV